MKGKDDTINLQPHMINNEKSPKQFVANIIDEILNPNRPPKPISANDKIRIIIGLDIYPGNTGITNTPAPQNSIYSQNNFSEVAFLTDTYNLSLFCIVSLLFQSNDYANLFINAVNDPSNKLNWSMVAEYLQNYKKTILLNAKNHITDIDNILTTYPDHQVLFVGKSHTPTKYVNLKNYMKIYHCSPRAFANKSSDVCCKTYFNFQAKPGIKTTLNDFKIF